jgi:outer membrane receptor protein involved in Fe transport
MLILAAVLMAAGLRVNAQTATGEADIRVLDPSGAVVPNARIEVLGSNSGNLVRTLATNDSGVANATFLQPGVYDFSVAATGFDKLVQKGVSVRIGETVNLTLTLQTGKSTESVTVVGQSPLIEQKSSTLAQVTEQREIRALPLNGRNYLQLANLTAGAIPSVGSRDQSFAAYGNTGLQNAFLLDGARNDNYLRGLDNRARDMVRPPLDAINEFTVQTSNYSSEFGASAGGVVNVVTKSGTNEIHGTAYDYLRNDNFDAADYFAVNGHKPLLVQNQFGGSLGGPLIRNRAWLFGAYEGLHERSEGASLSTVPTADIRSGNFGSTPIYDPASLNSDGQRTAFAGNRIPASSFNPTGLSLMNWYPLPNLPGAANNYISNPSQLQTMHNSVLRGDVQVSDKDSMFGRLAIARSLNNASPALPPPAQTPVDRTINSEGLSYGYTRTFSPTTVNEFRFNWTRLTLSQDATQPLNAIIPGSLDPDIKSSTPTVGVTGFAGLGSQPSCCGNSPLTKSSGVWDISDNLSKSLTHHLLKMGVNVQVIRPSTMSASGGRGSFGFNGVFTQDPTRRPGTGSGAADLLLGLANTANTGTVANAVERGKYSGVYFNDQWQVRPNLSLNLGIRYEVFFPYTEVDNRMGNFIVEPGDPHFGQMEFAGLNGARRSLLSTDWNNIAPRIGFAYTVPKSSNLVIRGAFGIFYAQDQGTGVTNRMTSNPPFFGYGGISLISDQLNPASAFLLDPSQTLPRPTPIPAQDFVLVPSATTALVSWYPHAISPYVQEWNLSVQKQFRGNTIVEVNYVGNSGVHIWGLSQGNQPLVNGPGSPTNRRPLAPYTVASVKRLSPWNRSNYEGLSARIEKRFSQGFSFLSSFTYGHAIDMQNPALDLCDGCGSGNTLQNSYNFFGQRSQSDNNVPLRFVFSGLWELPFGKGKPWATSGVSSALFGGWSLAGIFQTQSGLPFTVSLPFDNANAGTVSFPNRVCSGTLSSPSVQGWFDTSCFVTPPQYQFGNSGRNILRGPGMNSVDFSVHRDFRLGFESTMLQVRAEAFNALNHPQLGMPGTTLTLPTTGKISSTSAPNRILQFAMRLSF